MHMDGKSLDIADDKKQQLKQLFPEIFSEDKIDFEKLKLILGEDAAVDSEHYELSWAGKYDAFKEIQKQTTATLIPDREGSVNFDTSENIFIEGENLEVLRVLQKSYYGKIKLIYIDPPYNTGGDHFVYPDDFSERMEEYQKRSGIKDEKGFLNKQDLWTINSKENGQFHSVWLSMMYPRLFLARNLLKEDGVLVCHIDENEIFNLQHLLDSVFGTENNVGLIVWDKKNPKGDSTKIAVQHEYLLVYAKNIEVLKERQPLKRPKTNAERMLSKAKSLFSKMGSKYLPDDLSSAIKKHNLDLNKKEFEVHYGLDKINQEYRDWLKQQNVSGGEAAYKYIDEEGDVYRTVSMAWPNKKKAPDDYFIPLIHPVTNKPCPIPERGWRNPSSTMKELLDKGLIVFGEDESKQPERKYLLKENMVENIPSVLPFGGSDDALLRELDIPFENPKPTKFAKSILKYFLGEEDEIILDFFAGSGTSAHACFSLNVEQESHHKFIMIQLPEAIDGDRPDQKAAHEFCRANGFAINIAEISKERIRRARNRILEKNIGFGGDLGFKAFKLEYSNFKSWRSDTSGQEEILRQLEVFQTSLKDSVQNESVIYELLLKLGLPLISKVKAIDLKHEDEEFHYNFIEDANIVLALEAVNSTLLQEMIAKKPQSVITLDSLFRNNDAFMTNFSLQLKEAGVNLTII